jgi:aminopeptidase N
MNKKLFAFVALLFSFCFVKAQLMEPKTVFTHGDTLRGSITPERAWWDVQRYDITVQPDYATKTISGKTVITYKVVSDSYPAFMQIDLQNPMILDSVLFNGDRKLSFTKEENVWHVQVPKQPLAAVNNVVAYFHGKPKEAVRPPWDGGWIWKKDAKGRPWMSVACQGLGASVWYPCKDHQSDEPDSGASLAMIVPDSLVAVGNGRLKDKTMADGLATYTWEVNSPINNYCIIPYIGKYVNWNDTLLGEKGKLDLGYWVLDYNKEKAVKQFDQVKLMLRAFEYWFGPYPFYEDSYKLVDAPHLGMEHQSATAYGNKYMNGYLGRDLSNTGWGLKWDYIIIHESGHEWFANNVTTKDIADMWVHEGLTDYSETLFTDYYYGKQAGNEYNYGQRAGIANKETVIGYYGVNKEGSGDMYPKGANLMHSIRHMMDNDEKFRQILRGLNKDFYHQTVTSNQVEQYISQHSGIDLSKVFDQYLRNTVIPVLEYTVSADRKSVQIRWTNCIDGFNMPLVLKDETGKILHFSPTTKWQKLKLNGIDAAVVESDYLEKNFYITTRPASN